jgi:uncharacterized protein
VSRTPEQIAADRARYEEHQRKGLQSAPRALPPPSALPAPPIADPLHVEVIPGGWYWWVRLQKGEMLRIQQSHGPATVALVAWSAADPSERLNLPDTVKVQWNTLIQKGRVLFSDMGRVLLSVTEDSTGGAHDVLMGGSTAASNAARYTGTTRNTRDNLVLLAGKLGLTRRDIPLALSLFAPVRVGEDEKLGWQPALLSPASGHFVELRAEMDLLVGLSNCPHPLDPNPDYASAPVTITRVAAKPVPPDDPCRTASAEAIRGFENNALAEA